MNQYLQKRFFLHHTTHFFSPGNNIKKSNIKLINIIQL